MELRIELRTLEELDARLCGELPVQHLELGVEDPLIQLSSPLRYELEARLVGEDLVITGTLELDLDCRCSRCLKVFVHRLTIADWICHIPIAHGVHSVDLTPPIREDILLAFPQRPLCDIGCEGLPTTGGQTAGQRGEPGEDRGRSSPWAELDKLTF